LNVLLLVILVFNIRVTSIEFVGNYSISKRDLLQGISSKKGSEFNETSLIYDSDRIKRFYNEKGFFNTQVDPQTKTSGQSIDIIFYIREGEHPKIKKIIIKGDSESKLKMLFDINLNDYFIVEKIKKTENKIEDYYKDNGYTFANVSSSILSDSGFLIFEIEKKELYYIRDIILKGLKTCRSEVVYQEIVLKKGEKFNKSKLRNSQRRIYILGFFSTVDIEILKEKTDSIDLIFNMRELKSRFLNFGIGISIPLSFLVSFGIEELNMFNLGHRFQIRPSFKINIEREWETKFEARYTIPYLTSARLAFSLLPFYWFENREEFIRKTRGAELRISKIFSENTQFSVANKYKLVDYQMVTLPDTFKGITNSMKFQFMSDYRNEFFNPERGIFLLPLVEFAGGILGGANDFLRLELEERFFLPLFRNTFAQRLKAGIILPTDGVSVDEKYDLGGQYSLRGYPEKSVGPDSLGKEKYGNILGNINLEYRINLPKNWGLIAFFDVGYVDNKINWQHREFIKADIGLGLRYYTLIGPLRADLGFPLTEKGKEIYFGFYHIF